MPTDFAPATGLLARLPLLRITGSGARVHVRQHMREFTEGRGAKMQES